MSHHRIFSARRSIIGLSVLLSAAAGILLPTTHWTAIIMPKAVAEESSALEAAQGAKDEAAQREVTQGALRIIGEDGSVVQCPLKHTDVKADVSGFIARVNVTQTFHNPTEETIEAVYVFPLPHEAAVDAMTMQVGDRKIVGVIKRRDQARQIYEQALSRGQTAALLEQERPNIFTQSVGNIAPDEEVKIHISYVDVLNYDSGEYEFHFPMVVGPRFIPGRPVGSRSPTPPELQGKVSPPVPNTTRVPDAERITPPVLRPEVRNGHDISLAVSLDAAVPVQDLEVANHEATVDRQGESKATVTLSPADSLPNKDFVLRYAVVGEKPEMAVLAHTAAYSQVAGKPDGGYFMLMIQPKEDERLKKSPPREMVFLVDVSGSMRGAKTNKTREMMQFMLNLCRGNDTVQVVTFANQAQKLFAKPLPVDEDSIQQALNFTDNLRGSGGTHMLQGVKLAIDEPIDSKRVRIIVMLTDGFIGNEAEIIRHVGKNCGDQIRFWTIGIGQSPNMFLIDGVARQGGGMGKRLGLNDDAESLSHEMMTRIQRAQLANVEIDWGSMQATETYPASIPELWSGRPVILFGRYRTGGRHEIAVSGSIEGQAARWPLTVELPESQAEHDVLAKVWARKKIENLMHQTFYTGSPAVEEEVTKLALDYGLMTQYTSFVAVDEQDTDQRQSPARRPRRMLVPVPLPEGAEWEGFFGERDLNAFADVAFGVHLSQAAESEMAGTPRGQLLTRSHAGGRGIGGGFGTPQMRSAQAGSTRVWFSENMRPATAAAAPPVSGLKSVQSKQPLHPKGPTAGFGLIRRGRTSGSQRLDALGFAQQHIVTSLEASQTSIATAMRPRAGGYVKAALAAINEARNQGAKGDRNAACAGFTRACFLDQAAANFGYSRGQVASEALAALEQIHRRRVASWTKQQPALEKVLDLVIRDRSIDEALRQIADSAALEIRLVPGSLEDAARLKQEDVRVRYVDLRGATVAQALDWILWPARLNWRLENEAIVAGSERRLPGPSAWVYDVSHIAIPSDREMAKYKETHEAMGFASRTAGDFIRVVRGTLQTEEQLNVAWFAPGQLFVFGTPEQHDLAARLFSNLEEPHDKVRLEGGAGRLQMITSRRAAERKAVENKISAARHRLRIAQLHAAFGWQLLAAAAEGRLDAEALTELSMAWNDPATTRFLAGKGRALVMRSLWIVTEASRALHEQPELATLARRATEISRPFVSDAVKRLEHNPDDDDGFAALLYAALAMRDDSDLQARALKLLNTEARPSEPAAARVLAESLLSDPEHADRRELSRLVTAGVSGQDLTVLTALACRRSGGEAWQTFRAEARDLLGSQPLPGDAIILINRLSEDHLALTGD